MDNYEEKYKKALNWIQGLYKGLHGKTKEEAEKAFPELKNSENKNIPKALLNWFENCEHVYFAGIDTSDIIAWLKKQIELSMGRDLQSEIDNLSKCYPEVPFAKLSRIAVHIANWQKQQIAKDNMLLPFKEYDNLMDSINRKKKEGYEAGYKQGLIDFKEKQRPTGCLEYCVMPEDERIRKAILEHIQLCTESIPDRDKFIAWLEKQEIKKHDVCDTCDEKASCVNPCPVKLIEEQKPINSQFTPEQASILDKHIDKFLEQKPADWSEEDEKQLNDIIELLPGLSNRHNWLKSLKERVQPQPKWSEEDEDKFNQIRSCIEAAPSDVCYYSSETLENWLKSIKPQSHWKPSEEQMTVLKEVCVFRKSTATGAVLCELYYDLEKLRKE